MRPTRKSIIGNLSMEQQVLMDHFLELGFELRVIRSRRRPIPTRDVGLCLGAPAVDEWEWQSPAQLGRQKTRAQRGPNSNGPGWAHRTKAAQARINEQVRFDEINTRSLGSFLRAIYEPSIESMIPPMGLLESLIGWEKP